MLHLPDMVGYLIFFDDETDWQPCTFAKYGCYNMANGKNGAISHKHLIYKEYLIKRLLKMSLGEVKDKKYVQ
ncbi:MAG: hypothetical protein ACXU8A_01245 [Burkholderiaceae bacterium]